MAKTKSVAVDSSETPNPQAELAQAILQALQASQPVTKKTISNFKSNNPWLPKDGSPRAKLKRKVYQHGVLIGDRVTNEEINLLNQIRPGSYCDGHVKIIRRRDKGLDIDYPIKTASQRLKLVAQFGITSLVRLLEVCIAEAAAPKKDEFAETNVD